MSFFIKNQRYLKVSDLVRQELRVVVGEKEDSLRSFSIRFAFIILTTVLAVAFVVYQGVAFS